MSNNSYKNYLNSEHWKDVKYRFNKSKLNKKCCYACKNKENLNLHHKTYKRLGHEKLNDLIYLCQSCHNIVHNILKTRKSNKTNLFNVAKKLRKVMKKHNNDKNKIKYWINLGKQTIKEKNNEI